jgi:ABC-2 type transport system permease protein
VRRDKLRDLIAILRKEILELIRDYRTLLFLTLMPLVTMPLIAYMMTSLQMIQIPSILIVNEDGSSGYIGDRYYTSSDIISLLREKLAQYGVKTFINKNSSSIDLMVIIPNNFVKNLTSLDTQAFIQVFQVPGSSASDKAYNALISVVSDLSRSFSDLKIEYLGKLAKVNITNPAAIREPISASLVGYIAPSGAGISYEEAWRIFIARLLAFSLIFVSTPATTYIVDSILGEKERKTLEILLSTPVNRRYLILGKVFASSIVGLLAAIVDVIAIILFFVILSLGYGVYLMIDPMLLLITGVVVYLTTLATLSITLPLIIRSSTMRTAQVVSSVVTIVSSLIFLSVLFIDLYSLPRDTQYLLSLIPYTNSVLAIQYYAFGEIDLSLAHLLVLISLSISLIILSSKLINEEKLLLKPL